MRPALVAIAILVATCAQAQVCDPQKMVRVVYRDISPGVDPSSPGGQPETLYRLGTKYARVEGAIDRQHNTQPVMVANEPDIWMIDLLTKHGRHFHDTDAGSGFKAPVVGDPDLPPSITALEFGCEMAFMKGVPTKKADLDGQRVSQYEKKIDRYRVVLSVMQRSLTPISLFLYDGAKLAFALRYDEYNNALAPKMELFQRPEGITYAEEK
ncbi:MAG TPA: hypothetical protein VFV19_19680 [Candidatus Polarisedimenticolaceae bacterium]|nr:hypothetical protein [Candidatus Polarisedimenticolaceae bacterium]